MKKTYRVQFEQLVTKTGFITAESKEEAEKLAYDGDFIEEWEDDTANFRILEIEVE